MSIACQRIIEEWYLLLKKGTDFDSWGQPVEAVQAYTKLSGILRKEGSSDAALLSDEQKKIVNKVAACLEIRSKDLQHHQTGENISFSDVKKVEGSFVTVLTSDNSKKFPVEVRGAAQPISRVDGADCFSECSSQASKHSDDIDEVPSAEEIVEQRTRGTVLPPPEAYPGLTVLAVRIEKIGLKDASQYIDSFITMSVKDDKGKNVTVIQDTAISSNKDDTAVYFDTDLYVQKPTELLPEDFAIFFEFKHYKPRKQIISTKCWSFLEKDEIKEGKVVTELYKKPTDARRKKINLLTVKPLYLHLKLSLIT